MEDKATDRQPARDAVMAAVPANLREPLMIVDLGAIQRNHRRLAAMTKGQCAAIVKGDGYGHGMVPCSRALMAAGVSLLFTARLDDAVSVREALGAKPRIAVLDGVFEADLEDAVHHSVIPVINSPAHLHRLADASRRAGRRLPAFIHIDTAMNRLGLTAGEIAKAADLVAAVDVQAYMTHFASADDGDVDLCRRQVERLREAIRPLPAAPVSISNSCGSFLGPEFHGDIIRPGKATYGVNPLTGKPNPMEQSATVIAPVVQVRNLTKGDPVGYSRTWHAPDARRIAVIALGYANGYLRTNSNAGHVAFDGVRAPVIGRVSMDLTAVDITHLPEGRIQPGSIAEFVGRTIDYRTYAKTAGTNEHEAMIALGRGCRRAYVGAEDDAAAAIGRAV